MRVNFVLLTLSLLAGCDQRQTLAEDISAQNAVFACGAYNERLQFNERPSGDCSVIDPVVLSHALCPELLKDRDIARELAHFTSTYQPPWQFNDAITTILNRKNLEDRKGLLLSLYSEGKEGWIYDLYYSGPESRTLTLGSGLTQYISQTTCPEWFKDSTSEQRETLAKGWHEQNNPFKGLFKLLAERAYLCD